VPPIPAFGCVISPYHSCGIAQGALDAVEAAPSRTTTRDPDWLAARAGSGERRSGIPNLGRCLHTGHSLTVEKLILVPQSRMAESGPPWGGSGGSRTHVQGRFWRSDHSPRVRPLSLTVANRRDRATRSGLCWIVYAVVLRRKLRRERLKPVLVMETAEDRFRSNPMSLRNLVTG